MGIESLSEEYKNTVSVLSTLGTWAAVLASLWIAAKSQKPKLRVFVNKNVLIPTEAQTAGQVDWDKCEDSIGVDIQNVGPVTVYIHYWSFIWRLPVWRSAGMQCNPYMPDFPREPIKLDPGQSASISLTNDLEEFRVAIQDLCRRSNVPPFFRRFARLHVTTANGSKIKAKAGDDLKKWFKEK